MLLTRRSTLAVIAGAAGLVAPGLAQPSEPPLRREDYAAARSRFRTRLLKRGPAPDDVLPLDPPEGAQRIAYRSEGRDLAAWLSSGPAGKPGTLPAVLVLHGGNVMSQDHWLLARPFVAAGFVAMVPTLRGENGQGGDYSGFYDETADVLAAAQALGADPRVDKARLYLAGHSIGGTQVLLAAMASPIFRAACALSGAPDAAAIFGRFPEMIVFDTKDPAEFEMRSALCYAGSFKCPLRLWHGSEEKRAEAPAAQMVERAKAAGLDVAAAAVAGGHMTALPEELARSVAFFRERGAA